MVPFVYGKGHLNYLTEQQLKTPFAFQSSQCFYRVVAHNALPFTTLACT